MGACVLFSIVVPVVVAVLPSAGRVELDAAAGFVAGLVPMATLAWLVALIPGPDWVVGALAGGAALLSVPLSWGGSLVLAVPLKVIAAVSVGRLLGRQVADAWWLGVVALLALVADLWSVFAGPTRAVVEEAPRVLDYLLVHFSVLGGPLAGLGLGMSDFVFIGLYVAGSQIAGLRVRATFFAVTGSLVFSMLFAVLVRPAIPALPLMSIGFLVVNADRLAADLRRRHGE